MNPKTLRAAVIGLATICSVLVCSPAFGQKKASCPLTEEQSKKAVDAFAKVAAFVLTEPRCVNCHGGVNPYIDGIGLNPADPTAPPALREHGGGAIPKSAEGTVDAGCMKCHNHMAPKRDGSPTRQWFTAANFHSFVDKNAVSLCRQFKRSTGSAEEFLGHLTDDNGGNNFAQTAFNGDRGLSEEDLEGFSVTVQKPSISKPAFFQLAQNWVSAMGGKFQGDESCGCEVTHDQWSGSIHFVADSRGDEGNEKWSDWSNRSLSTITIDVKDGVGTMKFTVQGKETTHNQSANMNGTLNHGSSTVDTAIEKTIPVRVDVDIDPKVHKYNVTLGYSTPATVGKNHIENCYNGACDGADVDVYPRTMPVGAPMSGTILDPNHIQGFSTEQFDGQGRSRKGITIETLTVDLWRSGSSK